MQVWASFLGERNKWKDLDLLSTEIMTAGGRGRNLQNQLEKQYIAHSILKIAVISLFLLPCFKA